MAGFDLSINILNCIQSFHVSFPSDYIKNLHKSISNEIFIKKQNTEKCRVRLSFTKTYCPVYVTDEKNIYVSICERALQCNIRT